MISSRRLGVGVVGLFLSTLALHGQTGPQYRDFQLGGSLASVAALSGAPASLAATIHQRPALIQAIAGIIAAALVISGWALMGGVL